MNYIVSLKHTNKKDKFLTLWRPDNKGYCYPLELAGLYSVIEKGYHDDEGNKPVEATNPVILTNIALDDEGRACIKNNAKTRELLLQNL